MRVKKLAHDKTLEALKVADQSGGVSIGILVATAEAKPGLSYEIFKACVHFIKDTTVSTRHIRVSFEDSEVAGVLQRRILKDKKLLRESLI